VVHQTSRLNGIVEDLRLLSRLGSGCLQLQLAPVSLSRIVETCLDDLHLLHAPEVETDVPAASRVLGDSRYTLIIVQNLLDNARKCGCPGEPIWVLASEQDGAETVRGQSRQTDPACFAGIHFRTLSPRGGR
jgi:signal transduction histidine kinase